MLVERLPVAPPASLDRVLDAAEVCLARHGLSKTTLTDIAREMGVVPSTVYRKVGSVENAAVLLAAREAAALLETLPEVLAEQRGARAITVLLAEAIETFARHPVFTKLLSDDLEVVSRLVIRRFDELNERAAELSAPFLEAAMEAGAIRRQDPLALAHWLVRVAGIALLSPPPGGLRDALDALLLPMLEPQGRTGR
ncbi:MAG TPA: TetR/AcrR family transcriptional regulator [Acidimicrobiales bacterium]|nr:TetR/AcrR family transcriptional regulator [Acidimicrobiales bacterium]